MSIEKNMVAKYGKRSSNGCRLVANKLVPVIPTKPPNPENSFFVHFVYESDKEDVNGEKDKILK